MLSSTSSTPHSTIPKSTREDSRLTGSATYTSRTVITAASAKFRLPGSSPRWRAAARASTVMDNPRPARNSTTHPTWRLTPREISTFRTPTGPVSAWSPRLGSSTRWQEMEPPATPAMVDRLRALNSAGHRAWPWKRRQPVHRVYGKQTRSQGLYGGAHHHHRRQRRIALLLRRWRTGHRRGPRQPIWLGF
jgi:hypothetical protein